MDLERQKAFQIARMFNSIAHRYDFLNHFLSLGIDHLWRKKALKQINLNSQALVLDLATGTGDFAYLALKKGAGFVVGVDPARNMLLLNQDKFSHFEKKYMRIEGFGEELPLKSEIFSHVLIAFGIRNCVDRKKTFREIRRILKKGGELLILEFSQIKYPFIAKLFEIYFHKILPILGGWISGNQNAYSYLPESVTRFVSPQTLSQEVWEEGFEVKKVLPLFFGLCVVYLFGKK